ncbi:MAG: hypothetical protein CO135_03835 [Candidatus Levybacteria bacterium CG_4_9_14_3_um_filter_35_16]|nr:MAG: hypothetical protein COW87_01995 [Candidatus Levybacteria bacterium CG22_combo_CG10-13_8_21_14_all_35_11]PIY94841.1 MAG: hypothetical protein COY68_01115 [Candidatus Levybacteria bacterium CG_4_10_14_0_8_um_filter_35_23]PIZ98112.1 MAG: hypothetical protein COX78_03770 [Candidatus Levybacteria bacterium CG_4_10_14_0_2_um_filter_35_8]PJA90905.1 MAG: hypothetical protein CO135_03835 [Candidatus Levybacteria bacterium CG_4_9_14_3_um_filter_35_16]PJC54577.1 MAG: hypothetical protein CO028_01
MNPKNVAVIGIGRVGLPMALVLAEKGYNVFGIGRSKEKIENLLKGTILPAIYVLLKRLSSNRY